MQRSLSCNNDTRGSKTYKQINQSRTHQECLSDSSLNISGNLADFNGRYCWCLGLAHLGHSSSKLLPSLKHGACGLSSIEEAEADQSNGDETHTDKRAGGNARDCTS